MAMAPAPISNRYMRYVRVYTAIAMLVVSSKPCQASPADCSTVPGTYGVTDVVASGTSLEPYGEKKIPDIKSTADCCAACKKVKECNIWNHCNRKEGCLLNFDSISYADANLKPRNFCILRTATGYYQWKFLKAVHSGFISGKIDSRGPKMEKHPPAVPNEWKCSPALDCRYRAGDEFLDCNKRYCPSKSCNATRGLYETPLILDPEVNSHGFNAGMNHPPAVSSAAGCCASCTSRKGCDVWNYCWDPLGCGSPGSCTAYHPKWTKAAGGKRSEYWGHYGDYCTPDGRFPRDFCILRKAGTDLSTVKAIGPQGAYSWTSGKVQANF